MYIPFHRFSAEQPCDRGAARSSCAKAWQADVMRALHRLLAGFGFLFGFLIVAVSTLIEWISIPTRTDFSYAGEATASIAVSYEAIYLAIAIPLAGALLGWLLALIATYFGWTISRQTSLQSTRGAEIKLDDAGDDPHPLHPSAAVAHSGIVENSRNRHTEHPERTPAYGVLMIVVALAAAITVSFVGPVWLRIVVYVLAVAAIAVGFVFTLRDYST